MPRVASRCAHYISDAWFYFVLLLVLCLSRFLQLILKAVSVRNSDALYIHFARLIGIRTIYLRYGCFARQNFCLRT